MREVVDLIEQFPLSVQQWADILTLIGICGGIVFSAWIVGGAIADITRPLFKRPNQKLKGKHRRYPNNPYGTP